MASIVDSKEDDDGEVSYKVRWKGFSHKHDSWLPKQEMSCPEMIANFEDSLEKLSKKEDWVVSGGCFLNIFSVRLVILEILIMSYVCLSVRN